MHVKRVLIIGAGPAGLMAAEVLSARGCSVLLCEAKPSVGRKFLMAGKSGLNLTMDVPLDTLMPAYAEAGDDLRPMLQDCDAQAVKAWAGSLGQPVFTGSTGRVFPKAMKASPLLRAWLARLTQQGVEVRTRMQWQGWRGDAAVFKTPEGLEEIDADVTVLALGGASWARLGSDGQWADLLRESKVDVAPFQPANAGVCVAWSPFMARHYGTALKNILLTSGTLTSRGEAVISRAGLEGGGVYSVSRAVREGASLSVDLLPDLAVDEIAQKIARPKGKSSLSNHLRRVLRLDPVKIALAQETAHPLPTGPDLLAQLLKNVQIPVAGMRLLDEAISVAGGVRFSALTEDLMLKQRPGVFCAGEMLDWEAPTGGYLLTACFATGRRAGLGAVRYLENAA
ncbi:MAG: TIGR03862 family flavoprotein [Roseobacter sp.]